ncbi:RNA polymerase sigma factor [Streptomyces fungicidicus]|uniref:RNA polymerase sigma factor n=1 Tax=Streptomyces fungicidicus TaxID=68203 RepID=UPI0037F9C616
MSILAEHQVLVQLAPLAADEHGRTKEPLPQRPRGPHPYGVGVAGRFSRPEDAPLRGVLAGWVSEYHGLVVAVAARTLKMQDRSLAEDVAQDVWLAVWQHLLSGRHVDNPRGFLTVMTRRRVYAHYALARVRREESTDYSDAAAVARLASWLEAAA